MEFWGVEVKSGEPLKVKPGEGIILHLSQVSLGELKKDVGNESVCLFVNVDGKKLVLATLFTDKLPQQQLDLIFDRDFELSHNWKSGAVFFYGYKTANPDEDDSEGDFDDSDSEDDSPLPLSINGKTESKVKPERPTEKDTAVKDKESDAGKQKVKIVEPIKDAKADDDDESSDEDFMSEDDDEDGSEDEDDEDDSDDESDESDEETPKKVEPSKKRAGESATKTPASNKKAKVTPQKTDGKKGGGHVATPHPAKHAGKTPSNKPNNAQTPKSGGSHLCKSCNRTFGSEQGLESHSKAKHGGGK